MLKKSLVWLARVGAALLLCVAAFALYVQIDGLPHFAHVTPERHVVSTPERVARGRQLASLLCADCHLNPSTGRLTGKHLAELPPVFGHIVSKNITRSVDKGIATWTDGEIAYLLRTGVRRDGQYIPPYMVKLPHISDEDLDSVIAFLRSDDPMVAAAEVAPPGVSEPSFLSKVLSHTVMQPLPFPTQRISAPARNERVAYGKYLVYALDCYSCHSADFKSVNVMDPPLSEGFFGGGNTLLNSKGEPVYSANLTPDEQTGIGKMTEHDFVRTMRTGIRPDGYALSYPMVAMTELDEQDLGSIYAYLRTVPKLNHVVTRVARPATESDAGKQAYVRYGCTSCHGDNGLGIGDLRPANRDYPQDAELLHWILDAPSIKPGTRMPAWRGVIAETDYPALLGYVRKLSGVAQETAQK